MNSTLKISRTILEINSDIQNLKKKSGSLGFVPTMGALHEGHISLIKRSIEENDITVVSIFINPNQFNDNQDFLSYPRNLENDIDILRQYEIDLVFVPSVGEIYPEPDTRVFDFGELDQIMEGKYRPGHFNGVAQVVSRLFEIIKPERAYFGEKDFQQLAIIRIMVEKLRIPVQILGCPIIREPDGLAMSSRNILLTPAERESAARISRALFQAQASAGTIALPELIRQTCQIIQKDSSLKVEYLEIVGEKDLMPAKNWDVRGSLMACIAVQIGKVRLIDNVKFSS